MEGSKSNGADAKLYVIGNGFDIHHGIKSRYSDFENYVQVNNPELFEKLQEYFDQKMLWSDFEGALAEIDMDQIEDECSKYIVSQSSEEWRDSDWHVYGQEVEARLELITVVLRQEFVNWILSLEIPDDKHDRLLVMDGNARFLNFNYTRTLERLYNIKEERVNHIHGLAIDPGAALVLGHGRSSKSISPKSGVYNADDYDYVTEQGNESMDRYYSDTFKPSQEIIQENFSYFQSLHGVMEVHVYGLSFSLVDRPYITAIISSVAPNARWTISYHDASSVANVKAYLVSIGISATNMTFIRLPEIQRSRSQTTLF